MNFAVVVGGGSKLGLAVIQTLVDLDFGVFCLDRNMNNIAKTDSIFPIMCDFGVKDSVNKAIKSISLRTDHLEVLVNIVDLFTLNYSFKTSIFKAESLMNENFEKLLQSLNLFNEFMFGSGKIINVVNGFGCNKALPFNSLSNAVEGALKIFTDGLRREGFPANNDIILIKTSLPDFSNVKILKNQAEYLTNKDIADAVKKFNLYFDKFVKRESNFDNFSKFFAKILNKKKLKKNYNFHIYWKIKIINILPNCVFDYLTLHMHNRKDYQVLNDAYVKQKRKLRSTKSKIYSKIFKRHKSKIIKIKK